VAVDRAIGCGIIPAAPRAAKAWLSETIKKGPNHEVDARRYES
jgi:hypothetical protein